ncbi:hypothetical protein [Streptomyces sp. NPDC005890]|uniref:hypothetical protein n=1 Tax=Streptomyces sp. NPDC005890 TaxID=3154568 RepID=UPI0033E0E089
MSTSISPADIGRKITNAAWTGRAQRSTVSAPAGRDRTSVADGSEAGTPPTSYFHVQPLDRKGP